MKFGTAASRSGDYQILDNKNHIQRKHTDQTSNTTKSESSIEDETNRASASVFDETTNENISGYGPDDSSSHCPYTSATSVSPLI